MTVNKKIVDEGFKSSYGVNAEVPDPVTKGSNKRPADKETGNDAPPKSKMISDIAGAAFKMGHAELNDMYKKFMALSDGGNVSQAANLKTITTKSVKEDLDLAFDGDELSESFKQRATTLFEAALDARTTEIRAELEEEYENRLEESCEEIRTDLSESVETYMDHVAKQWMVENKLAVTTGIRSDILESFMGGLKTLFTEHYIEIPEDKVDVVESLTAKVEELETRLNESENNAIAVGNQIQEMKAAVILADVAEGLTDTQEEKLRSICESVEFVNEDDYRTKLTTIAEGYVNKKAPKGSAAEQLNEEVELVEGTDGSETAVKHYADPLIESVMKSISKQVKK